MLAEWWIGRDAQDPVSYILSEEARRRTCWLPSRRGRDRLPLRRRPMVIGRAFKGESIQADCLRGHGRCRFRCQDDTHDCVFWYPVVMRRIQMVVERRSLHDPTLESRPEDEGPADRIAIVTNLVRTHHGWDDDETRPGLQRVYRVTARE